MHIIWGSLKNTCTWGGGFFVQGTIVTVIAAFVIMAWNGCGGR